MQIWRSGGLGREGSWSSVLYFHSCDIVTCSEYQTETKDWRSGWKGGMQKCPASCMMRAHDEALMTSPRIEYTFPQCPFCAALLLTLTVRGCFETRPGHPRTMVVGWLKVKDEKLFLSELAGLVNYRKSLSCALANFANFAMYEEN